MKNMSKKTIMILGLVIVLIVAALCIMKYNKEKRKILALPQAAFFSEREILIKARLTNYRPAHSGSSFTSKDSLEQIEANLAKDYPDALIEIRDNSLFISIYNQDTDKLDYYYVYYYKHNSYYISNFKAVYGESGDYINFIIPMHLLCYTDDHRPWGNIGYGFGERFEMVQGSTIEDVYNFYQNSGYYEVEWNEDKVILINALCENKIEDGQVIINYQIEKPIVIKVTSREGKNYFTCKVEEGDGEK